MWAAACGLVPSSPLELLHWLSSLEWQSILSAVKLRSEAMGFLLPTVSVCCVC